MNWLYRYTPYVWPMLASAVLMAALGYCVWRRRAVAGALPLALAMFLVTPWAVGAALELAAADASTQIVWITFQAVWPLPAVTAVLCFVVEYAGLGRWLTCRTLALLAGPSLLALLLILTNGSHHWMWREFAAEGAGLRPVYGAGYWILIGYTYLLVALRIVVLTWMVVRSPRQRWPAGLMLGSQILTATAALLDVVQRNPVAPMNPTILAFIVSSVIFTIALFYFHILDPIPVARTAVLEQMREGMLVLDARQRIVDLNPAAAKLLGLSAARARGQELAQIVPCPAGLRSQLAEPQAEQSEIYIGTGEAARHYALRISPLTDRRGLPIGSLVLLHDVTEQQRAQAQLIEQQHAMAAQQERERLARELHDSLGQVLGYVSMQAQAIGKWLRDGQVTIAEAQLARLVDVAQSAHADIRAAIVSLQAGTTPTRSFFTALQQDLAAFQDRYGICTELAIPPGVEEQAFAPAVGDQLRRVIQEALTNARQHGHARSVQVAFEQAGDQAQILIADDGRGFDPEQLAAGGSHLGLAYMRERLAHIGGGLEIHSRPGTGTQVVLQVPIGGEFTWRHHEGSARG